MRNDIAVLETQKEKTITKEKQKRKKRRLITWSDFDDQKCVVMALFGQYASTIVQATGGRLTTQQVYYRARKAGVRLSDWRRGQGPYGELIFTRFTIGTSEHDVNQQVRRLFTRARPELIKELKALPAARK